MGVPRVALVHDFLLDLRGGERVFSAVCDAWPDADVFTAIYDEDGTEGRFAHRNPQTSFLQRLRPSARTFRPLLPLYPYAIESLDLRGYDIVVSSSSAWAHGVLPGPGAVHVCYCHNPFRYAWSEHQATLAARSAPVRLPLSIVLSRWRRWDWIAAQRVDRYVANSRLTASRIRRYFGREAEVLHPPVELARFGPGAVGDHYLVVAELMAHKRIDIAIEAFNQLGLPLVVVGDGPEMRRLRRLAGPSVSFAGRLPDPAVAALMQSARALVVTASEEFGIAAVESLASGRPVIALASGGVLEIVREGETGTYYEANEPASLAATVAAFDPLTIDPAACVATAAHFGTERFQGALRGIVDDAVRAVAGEERDRPAVVTGLLPRRAARRAAARGTVR